MAKKGSITRLTSPFSAHCMGQADCNSDDECPTAFICETACCRLATCPGETPVRFACTSNYQCGSKEKCIFGGCCPSKQNPVSLAVEDQAVEESGNPYDGEESPTKKTASSATTTHSPPHPTSMMPSFGPSDVCEVCSRPPLEVLLLFPGGFPGVQLFPGLSVSRDE